MEEISIAHQNLKFKKAPKILKNTDAFWQATSW